MISASDAGVLIGFPWLAEMNMDGIGDNEMQRDKKWERQGFGEAKREGRVD